MVIERNFLKINMSAQTLLILAFLVSMDETLTAGIGKAWDVSSSHKVPYPLRFLSWIRTDGSPFDIKTISGIGRLSTVTSIQQTSSLHEHKKQKRQVKNAEEEQLKHPNPNMSIHELMAKLDTPDSFSNEKPEEDSRGRRDAENQMEKIGVVKTIERSGSPSESWSKQPISVEFRHRTNLDELDRIDRNDDDQFVYPPRTRQSPRTDFVTSNRRHFSDSRESRTLPVSRQAYDDYDVPLVFRSYVGARDYQVPISRGTYQNRYRAERDYYNRVPMDMMIHPNLPYNRYRHIIDNSDHYVDLYSRIRPTTKPKRIIYYATLPEIVRKPVDIRNYPRYSGTFPPPLSTSDNSALDRNGMHEPATPRRPYNRYSNPSSYNKYSNTDPWNKRTDYYERIPQTTYRSKEQDRDQKSDALIDIGNKQMARNDDQRLPWPIQVAAEVNVKENERITGRKIFGRVEGYDDKKRYQKDVNSDQELSGN